MAMFRQFRLSVSPVTPAEWAAILAMAGETP
jgi:predicted RNA-binding protein with PUA-like domain